MHNIAETDMFTHIYINLIFLNLSILRLGAGSVIVVMPLTVLSWILGIVYLNKTGYFAQYMFSLVNALQVRN